MVQRVRVVETGAPGFNNSDLLILLTLPDSTIVGVAGEGQTRQLRDDDRATDEPSLGGYVSSVLTSTAAAPLSPGTLTLLAPVSGVLVPLDAVPDPAFAQRLAGDGMAQRSSSTVPSVRKVASVWAAPEGNASS